MERNNNKAWLYLLPAMLFLVAFMVYPLVDVFIYSFEEGYNSASQTYNGIGLYNYNYVLRDPYFLQAVKNTFILVMITVPISTALALVMTMNYVAIVVSPFGIEFLQRLVGVEGEASPFLLNSMVGFVALVPVLMHRIFVKR